MSASARRSGRGPFPPVLALVGLALISAAVARARARVRHPGIDAEAALETGQRPRWPAPRPSYRPCRRPPRVAGARGQVSPHPADALGESGAAPGRVSGPPPVVLDGQRHPGPRPGDAAVAGVGATVSQEG